jgi:hypothetical protein
MPWQENISVSYTSEFGELSGATTYIHFFPRTASARYIKFHQPRIERNKKRSFMLELLYFHLEINIIFLF